MKNNFDKCFDILLKHEGGFVNHPEDPGGAKNLGVTKRVMQEFLGRAVSMGEMKALKAEDGKRVYKKLYADKVHFDKLVAGLDWAVNSGPGRAAKALQKILGAKQDDAIGPKTLQAVANFDAGAVAALTEFFEIYATEEGLNPSLEERQSFSCDFTELARVT